MRRAALWTALTAAVLAAAWAFERLVEAVEAAVALASIAVVTFVLAKRERRKRAKGHEMIQPSRPWPRGPSRHPSAPKPIPRAKP